MRFFKCTQRRCEELSFCQPCFNVRAAPLYKRQTCTRTKLSPHCENRKERETMVSLLDTMAHSQTGKAKWKCMKQCGACCKLGDFDMEVLKDMLRTEDDLTEYLGMIGADGWCKWFDSKSRTCTKYEDRPRFCRATPEVFEDLYQVEKDEFDEFAISCCKYHISNIYGEDSHETDRFENLISQPSEQIQIYEDGLG